MAGFSRIIDAQKELQEKKPGGPSKGKMEPPIKILMELEESLMPEVIPIKTAVAAQEQSPVEATPIQIVMEDPESR